MKTTSKRVSILRVAMRLAQIGLMTGLLVLAGAARAADSVTTVTPDADAFVQSGNPTQNFGDVTKLRFRDSGSEVRMSYLKFTLPGIASGNMASAKLRLKTAAISGVDAPVGVYSVVDTSWVESTITWNNKPAMSGTALATALANDNPTRWVEWNVTDYVRAEMAAGRSVISLGVKRTSTGSADGEFQSREDGHADKIPQLVIIEGAPNSSALGSVADASVKQSNSPSSNYGTDNPLEIGTSSNNRQAFLKFDLSAVSAVGGAKLRVNGAVYNGTPTVAVYPVSDTSWGETTITWNNQPAAGATALASVLIAGGTAWYEWDVGAYAQAEKSAGRSVITLLLKQTVAGTNGANFYSREADFNTPYLLISSPPPPPPGPPGLAPTADATVSTWYPDTNFGIQSNLDAVKTASLGNERWSYIKFDLTSLPGAVTSAKINLLGHTSSSSGNISTAVYSVADTSWGEATITWNNRPATGGTALATKVITDGTDRWYEWDVTAYVQSEKTAGRNVVSFALKNPVGVDGVTNVFGSRESASTPRLGLMISTAPVAQISYVHTDHLNTPRLITNQSGQAIWRWDNSEPFGWSVPNEDPSQLGSNFTCNLRFPGQYFDKETNLHYNYFRDYDPAIGRYIQSDPIGLRGGINTYAYGFSNPLSYADPSGLEVRFMCRTLAGAAAGTSAALMGAPQNHCFVSVTCPEEGWSRILSMFGLSNSFPYGHIPFPLTGRKSLATPDTPNLRDDPNSATSVNLKIAPRNSCAAACAFEKDVINRFLSFPSTPVPYFPLGPNSNNFAEWLITSPTFGTGLPQGGVPNTPGLGTGWPGITQ